MISLLMLKVVLGLSLNMFQLYEDGSSVNDALSWIQSSKDFEFTLSQTKWMYITFCYP